MTNEFEATYRITIYSNKETLTVQYPITCKFNVTRGILSDSNRATIQLYNLAPSTRNQIFQDQYTLDPKKWKYVHLEAGYGDKPMSLIFKGRILQAYSFKSGGQTDVVTEIQAIALDIFDYQASYTFSKGTTFKEAHNTIASNMPNVTIGNIGSLNGIFKTPTTFDGMAMEELNKLTGGHTFVDNGVLNTLMDNEVIDVPVPIISNSTNLLETPMRRDANLEVKTLFLPDIIAGQLVEIDSSVSPNFNGQFKLVGFSHDCLISPSVSGTRTTQMTLWIGPMLPNSNIALTGTPTGGAATARFNAVRNNDVYPVNSKPVYPKWIMPCKGRITSEYGWRIHPVYKTKKMHNGWDIAVPTGTPVKAVADGRVIKAGIADGYGYAVVLDHGKINGKIVTSEYGHISSWNVAVGNKVKQGQVIAKSGNKGASSGPHLHLTIREGAYRGIGVPPGKYININSF